MRGECSPDISLIIAAAGRGSRMGGVDKALIEVEGASLLEHCLVRLGGHHRVQHIVVVGHSGILSDLARIADGYSLNVRVAEGGSCRGESVLNGLRALDGRGDLVAIHDVARPFASRDLLQRLAEVATRHGAAIPGIPLRDTIKEFEADPVSGLEVIVDTPVRSALRAIQTPQVFEHNLLRKAYERWAGCLGAFTDDASLLEALEIPVALVSGEEGNDKVTFPDDLANASRSECLGRPRVGIGYDSHRLVAERPLILAGVTIPSPVGLQGHSDADVVYHAVMDAMLGAASLGDIGQHFPPDEPAWSGARSGDLLRRVADKIRRAGFEPENIDVTVVIERPRIGPHIPQMIKNMAIDAGIPSSNLSIKASTDEGMGPIGRGEGAAAWAVCCLRRFPI